MREQDITRLSDSEAQRLARFYGEAEKEIIGQINRALLRGNQTSYLKGMLENVNIILEQLRAGSRTWCEKAIPRMYVAGLEYADTQMEGTSAPQLVAGFGAIHQQAVQVVAEAAYKRFDETAVTIGRRADDIYRTLALENVRGSVTGYKTWEQVAKGFREQLAEQGVTGFKDKLGRQWDMRTYSEMVARTTTAEAHWEGTSNRLLEHGIDLVIISTHAGSCEKCAPWQGQVVSLTGKTPGYPTMQEAKEAGLLHPNCRHTFSAYIDLDSEIGALEKELNEDNEGIRGGDTSAGGPTSSDKATAQVNPVLKEMMKAPAKTRGQTLMRLSDDLRIAEPWLNRLKDLGFQIRVGDPVKARSYPEFKQLDAVLRWQGRRLTVARRGFYYGPDNAVFLPEDYLLGKTGHTQAGYNLGLHEVAHGIRGWLASREPSISREIDTLYAGRMALGGGGFIDPYSAVSSDEYWAQSVMHYAKESMTLYEEKFRDMFSVRTKGELQKADPAMYDLVERVMKGVGFK